MADSVTTGDGRRTATIIGARVVVDGIQQPQFGVYVESHSLIFSPNGERLAYVVRRDGNSSHSFAVVDGRPYRRQGGTIIDFFAFSPDSNHFAYRNGGNGKGHVVIDRAVGPHFDHCGSIVFSPDSRFCAYEGAHEGGWRETRIGMARLLEHFEIVVKYLPPPHSRWAWHRLTRRLRGYSGPVTFSEDSASLHILGSDLKTAFSVHDLFRFIRSDGR